MRVEFSILYKFRCHHFLSIKPNRVFHSVLWDSNYKSHVSHVGEHQYGAAAMTSNANPLLELCYCLPTSFERKSDYVRVYSIPLLFRISKKKNKQ